MRPTKLIALRYFDASAIAIVDSDTGSRLYNIKGIQSLMKLYQGDADAQRLLEEIRAKMLAIKPHELEDISDDDVSGQSALDI